MRTNKVIIRPVMLGLAFFIIFIKIHIPVVTFSQVYNELPADFPDFNINISNNPTNGNYFLSGSYFGSETITYSIILDTLAIPVFFKKHPNPIDVMGFTRQNNGVLSYHRGSQNYSNNRFILLDSTYNILNELSSVNGYFLDSHEFILEDDGDYWVLAYDIRQIDMSLIVDGGHPNATVIGCVIQHISEAQSLLFQWNSWDHMQITDCDTMFVDLTGQIIDYVHANALSFDYDGNILLSSRNLNEITKIDIVTGEIIWRWGGTQNQFTFSPDDCFYGQHTIRYNVESNTYTLFDNGNWHSPPCSRGVEYELDQNQLIANQIYAYNHDPEIFVNSMGGMQRMNDGGTIVNWSKSEYIFTEYGEDGEIVFEVTCPDSIIVSYRVEKHEWKTSLFDFIEEDIHFADVVLGDSATEELSVINNQNYPVVINGYNIENPVFSLETLLPVVISPNESQNFQVKFKPTDTTNCVGVLSLFHSTDTSRVAQQIKLTANTIVSYPEYHSIVKPDVLIYPNPMTNNSIVTLRNQETINRIQVIDKVGRIIFDKKVNNLLKVSLSAEILNTGFYNILVHGKDELYHGKLLVVDR